MNFGLKTFSVTLASIMLLSANDVLAGAWVPEVGSGYTKYAISNYEADEIFGDDSTDVKFSGRSYSFYGEYGVAENLAVYGTVLYQQMDQEINGAAETTTSGFGDAELGLKYQWVADSYVLSTSLLAKLPYLYDETEDFPRGNGQEDIELKVLLGKSLNQYGYLGFEAGYRYRTDAPSDEYRYLLEYGFSANENLYFRTKIDSTISANNADGSGGSSNVSIAPEFDLTKWELTAGWNFGKADSNSSRWGIEATYRQDINGDESLDGDAIEIGLARSF